MQKDKKTRCSRAQVTARAKRLATNPDIVSIKQTRLALGISTDQFCRLRREVPEFRDAVAHLKSAYACQTKRQIEKCMKNARELVVNGRARKLLDFVIITDINTSSLFRYLLVFPELRRVLTESGLSKRWRTSCRTNTMCFVTRTHCKVSTRNTYKKYHAANLRSGIVEPEATHRAIDRAVSEEMKARKKKRVALYGKEAREPTNAARRARPLASKKAVREAAKETFDLMRLWLTVAAIARHYGETPREFAMGVEGAQRARYLKAIEFGERRSSGTFEC